MRVTLLYFAAARERAGCSSETLQLDPGATLADALAAACAAHPALAGIANKLRLALDREFAAVSAPLREGAEVALIPPVSGGSGPHPKLPADPHLPAAASPHLVTASPLSLEAAVRAVSGPDCGAVSTFLGAVRDQSRGKAVLGLDYEAFEPMALSVFARIAAQARAQFAGARVAIHHRIGSLVPGELSVVIAAASPHRSDAFDACRYAIEELKRDAPIWKRERYAGGAEWIGLGS